MTAMRVYRDWVPEACTLPTAQRPLRLAEFDALFTTALRRVERLAPTGLRLTLTGPAGLEATVRDLTDREGRCCSFFTFAVTPDPVGQVVVDITVPGAYVDVLDALTALASRWDTR